MHGSTGLEMLWCDADKGRQLACRTKLIDVQFGQDQLRTAFADALDRSQESLLLRQMGVLLDEGIDELLNLLDEMVEVSNELSDLLADKGIGET